MSKIWFHCIPNHAFHWICELLTSPFIPGTESMSLNDDDDETSDGEDDDTRRGRIGQGHSASNSQSQNTAEDQEDVRTIIVS